MPKPHISTSPCLMPSPSYSSDTCLKGKIHILCIYPPIWLYCSNSTSPSFEGLDVYSLKDMFDYIETNNECIPLASIVCVSKV